MFSLNSDFALNMDFGIPYFSKYQLKTYFTRGLFPYIKGENKTEKSAEFLQFILGESFRWWIPVIVYEKETASAVGIVSSVEEDGWADNIYDGEILLTEGAKIPLEVDITTKTLLWEYRF